jgi:hypothetical protein
VGVGAGLKPAQMERAKLSVLQTSVYKSVTELTSQYNPSAAGKEARDGQARPYDVYKDNDLSRAVAVLNRTYGAGMPYLDFIEFLNANYYFESLPNEQEGGAPTRWSPITLLSTATEATPIPPPGREGEPDLAANAGPDQTVPGPSPVAVQFDGSDSTGDIVSYEWYNQWGLLRAEGATPVIEVNFGHKDPQPGTQRTLTLLVADSQGNTAQDEVTITLGKTSKPAPTPIPPTPTLTPTPTPSPEGFLLPWDGDENPQYFTGGPHPTLNSTTKSAIDFSRGTYQVLSIGAGVVAFTGRAGDRWSGNVVVIIHDNGIQSEYWHLASIESTLTVGSRIPRGYPMNQSQKSFKPRSLTGRP